MPKEKHTSQSVIPILHSFAETATLGRHLARAQGKPLYDIHAQSAAQLEFGRAYAEVHPEIVRSGF